MPLMSWVVEVKGVGLSDPIQRAHKKSRPEAWRWTRVAMATRLPLGRGSAGNQLKACVCVNGGFGVGGNKSVMSSEWFLAMGGEGRTA